mgnify:CR=1 FL=1
MNTNSLHRKERNMELSEIRNEIDKLDKQIQNLFEERMLLCRYFKPDGNSRSWIG